MHLWNAGIFLFSSSTILEAFAVYAPETLAWVRRAHDMAETDLGFTRLAPEHWSELEDISIDFAVMERAPNLSVMPYSGSWSDLGDWQSVWREGEPDGAGVVTSGPSTPIDCKNTLLQATSDAQELVAIGLEDVIAVAMPDAVLVAHKDCAQDVKRAVTKLKAKVQPRRRLCPVTTALGLVRKHSTRSTVPSETHRCKAGCSRFPVAVPQPPL